MKKILISTLAVSALLFTVSCKTDFDQDVSSVVVTKGSADFSKYISIGNSLTSGYSNGALYSDGQNESFPSMIAGEMKLAGGGDFTQPLMPNNVGGFTNLFLASGGTDFYGKFTLKVVNGSLSPTPSAPAANLDIIGGPGKYFSNMGVPGAKSFHLLAPGYGNVAGLSMGTANPYFVRFATSSTTSVIADAMAQKPTFFSLWIGNNDVLFYATSGGVGVDQKGNLNPATYGSYDISDPNVVAGSIKGILDGLKSVGATKGVIANIPSVTSLPYFTTVPATPITGLSSGQVSALNSAFASYNAGLGQAKALGYLSAAEYTQRLITFTTGINGATIVDKDLTNLSALGLPSYRQTTSKDLIVLSAGSVLGKDATTGLPPTATSTLIYGTTVPLIDKYVLTQNEAAKVAAATAAYNTAITSLASSYGLALVDANSKLIELGGTSGISFNGVKYTANFVTGGTFSLDGVHLTGRGYGLIANEFLKQINATYGSTLPMVDINKYSGVKFP